jgi:hypothetical protein
MGIEQPFLDRTTDVEVGGKTVQVTTGTALGDDVDSYSDLMTQIVAKYNSGSALGLQNLLNKLQALVDKGNLSKAMANDANHLLTASNQLTAGGHPLEDLAAFGQKLRQQVLADYLAANGNGNDEYSAALKITPTLTRAAWESQKTDSLMEVLMPSDTSMVSKNITDQNRGLFGGITDLIGAGMTVFENKAEGLEASLQTATNSTNALNKVMALFKHKEAPEAGDSVGGVKVEDLQHLLDNPNDGGVIVTTPAEKTEYQRLILAGKSRQYALGMVLLEKPGTASVRAMGSDTYRPFASSKDWSATQYLMDGPTRDELYKATFPGIKTYWIANKDGKDVYAVDRTATGVTGMGADTFDIEKMTPEQQDRAVAWMASQISQYGKITSNGVADMSGGEIKPVVNTTINDYFDFYNDKVVDGQTIISPFNQLKAAREAIPMPSSKDYEGSLRQKLDETIDGIPQTDGSKKGGLTDAGYENFRTWIQDDSGDNQRLITAAITASTAFNDKTKQDLTAVTTQFQQLQQICMSLIQALQRLIDTIFRK